MALGESEDTDAARRALIMDVVRAHFRPDIHRIDDIILFHRLRRTEMSKIVEIYGIWRSC